MGPTCSTEEKLTEGSFVKVTLRFVESEGERVFKEGLWKQGDKIVRIFIYYWAIDF
jgi:hypothetical protein